MAQKGNIAGTYSVAPCCDVSFLVSGRDVSRERLAAQNRFEDQMESYEKEAREKCHSAIQAMQGVELSGWFVRLLENRILPGLRRIGFDELLAWALFRMAAPAWQIMGPITDKTVWFHPVLINKIEEIRSGIVSKARRTSEALSLLEGLDPQAVRSLVNKSMDPENLFSLLDDISTPWIILPRVYAHLEKQHSQYLLAYLKYLDNETNSKFGKILARITIEFVGNYTLKYINEIHPKDQMIDVLFYGYVAMFWKHLRNPPNGFEDIGIFENFLRWAKIFQKRCISVSCDMARTIESMEVEKEKTFPVFNVFGLARDSHYDVGRFLVTLRHGYPGIKTLIKFFGIGGPLLKNATDGRLPYVAVPAALSALFREIKEKYPVETPRTQETIREFLSRLGAIYDLKQINSVSTRAELSEQLRFVGPRLLGLIHDLTRSIHYHER